MKNTSTQLNTIFRGVSLFAVGRASYNLFRFIFNIILTRGLGATLYGVYSYAWTIVSIIYIFSRLGTGKSILRFFSKYENNPERQDWILTASYITTLIGSIVFGVAIFISAPAISAFTLESDLLTTALKIFAVTIPFNSLIKLTNNAFRGLELIEYQVLVNDIFQPIIQLGTVSIALLLGYSLLGVISGLVIAGILVFSFALFLLYNKTELRFTRSVSNGNLYEFYNFSVPLTFKDLGSILYRRVDILMVGFFLAESSVGIYQVALILTSVILIPLQGLNQLFPPIASRLYSEGEFDQLELVYQTVTRWSFTMAIIPTIGAILYRSELLFIFGSEFTMGSTVLATFAIAKFTNSAVGPCGFVIMMTDHQYYNLANQWLLGLINVIMNYYLILEFGLIGAAVATAATLTFINLLRVVEVWRLEQIFPYSKKIWKPIAASIPTVFVMYFITLVLSDLVLLAVGGVMGILTFLSILVLLGFENEDKKLFNEFVGN